MEFLKRYFPLLVCLALYSSADAAEWQWSVPVKTVISKETNDHPTAFLWVPPNCSQVRGVVLGQHNMLEEGILEHKEFRANLAKLGLAEIWITPGFDLIFNFSSAEGFEGMMKDLALKSGYTELEFSPIIPIGHSAAASYPWNFGALYPERTLAMLSIHGDAPLTNMTGSGQPNPEWGKRNIDGIPGLFVMGEYEWLEGRIEPAMSYQKNHPNAPISLFCDAGHGHFDFSDELITYLNLFISKAVNKRLPKNSPVNKPVLLLPVYPQNGWLMDRWRRESRQVAPAAPYAQYTGDKLHASWVFDSEMARMTEIYYARARGKANQAIAYVQQGQLLPAAGFAGFKPLFLPLADGISFRLSAVFVDPKTGQRIKTKQENINISRICGPVKKVDDSTFRIAFYRMGFNNSKRTNDIWLMASSDGNERFKSVVQQANIKIPMLNKEGPGQKITFPIIPDQRLGSKRINLEASSDAQLPVEYYIKEGPAEMKGSELVLLKVPPKSRFPVKITVVAWQYGLALKDKKLQSAQPVERTFMLYR